MASVTTSHARHRRRHRMAASSAFGTSAGNAWRSSLECCSRIPPQQSAPLGMVSLVPVHPNEVHKECIYLLPHRYL